MSEWPRRYYCPCGYSVSGARTYDERREAFKRHQESGEHDMMTKANALREGLARVDAIVEAHLQEDR